MADATAYPSRLTPYHILGLPSTAGKEQVREQGLWLQGVSWSPVGMLQAWGQASTPACFPAASHKLPHACLPWLAACRSRMRSGSSVSSTTQVRVNKS